MLDKKISQIKATIMSESVKSDSLDKESIEEDRKFRNLFSMGESIIYDWS